MVYNAPESAEQSLLSLLKYHLSSRLSQTSIWRHNPARVRHVPSFLCVVFSSEICKLGSLGNLDFFLHSLEIWINKALLYCAFSSMGKFELKSCMLWMSQVRNASPQIGVTFNIVPLNMSSGKGISEYKGWGKSWAWATLLPVTSHLLQFSYAFMNDGVGENCGVKSFNVNCSITGVHNAHGKHVKCAPILQMLNSINEFRAHVWLVLKFVLSRIGNALLWFTEALQKHIHLHFKYCKLFIFAKT